MARLTIYHSWSKRVTGSPEFYCFLTFYIHLRWTWCTLHSVRCAVHLNIHSPGLFRLVFELAPYGQNQIKFWLKNWKNGSNFGSENDENIRHFPGKNLHIRNLDSQNFAHRAVSFAVLDFKSLQSSQLRIDAQICYSESIRSYLNDEMNHSKCHKFWQPLFIRARLTPNGFQFTFLLE